MRWPFRRSSGFDPFSAAADRLERSRQAREEIGDPLVDAPLGYEPMRRPGGRWLWLFVAAAVAIGLGTSVRGGRIADLPANCGATVLRLSTTQGRYASPVAWRATGPEGDYALTLDATAISRGPGGKVTVDEPSGSGTWASPVFRMRGCKASGRFALTLREGEHTVRMFRFDPSGAHVVAEHKVTITE